MSKRWIILLLLSFVVGCAICSFATCAEGQDAVLPQIGEELPATLMIYMVDGDTKLPVTGAEFFLTKEDDTYFSIDSQNGSTRWVKSQEKAAILISDEDGIISIREILPGTYYLTESKAPNGYNLLEAPVKIHLTAAYAPDPSGTSEMKEVMVQVNDAEVTYSTAEKPNLVEITIENTYGTVLPDTGGIGTTIYYMLGMIVLFAVALTIAAKRLVKQEA